MDTKVIREIGKKIMKLLGHTMSQNGVSPDSNKVDAISESPAPQNISDLKRLMGMVTFMVKFVPHISSKMHPLSYKIADTSVSRGGKKIRPFVVAGKDTPLCHFADDMIE